ncbi:hypothetical protein MRX96_042558 [Rhipicephalus microplus]
MAASTKTGYDPSTMQWVDIEVAETREDPIPGEDEYLQIMVRQLQEKLAKMMPQGSTAAAQPQARKTGSTPAACVESPRKLATWKPTHTPRIRSDELVIVLKPKITMDLHAAFGPDEIGTAVQCFNGSTTNAGKRLPPERNVRKRSEEDAVPRKRRRLSTTDEPAVRNRSPSSVSDVLNEPTANDDVPCNDCSFEGCETPQQVLDTSRTSGG